MLSAADTIGEAVFVFVTGEAYRPLVIGLLAIAAIVAWRDWRQTRTTNSGAVALASSIMLAAIGLGSAFQLLARLQSARADAWAESFDRLIALEILVMLGWAFLPRPVDKRRQSLLFGTLGFAAGAFLWSASNNSDSSSLGYVGPVLGATTGLLAAGLAATIAATLSRTRAGIAPWLLTILAIQALAGLLEALLLSSHPLTGWWRLAWLGCGLTLAAAAFAESASLRDPARRLYRSPAPSQEQGFPASPATGEPFPSPRDRTANHQAVEVAAPRSELSLHLDNRPQSAGVSGSQLPSSSELVLVPAERRDEPGMDVEPEPPQDPRCAASASLADGMERIARFEATFARLPVGLLIADAAGRLLYANPLAIRVLSRPLSPGQPVAECFPDPPPIEQALRQVLGSGDDFVTWRTVELPEHELRLDMHRLAADDGHATGVLLVLGQRMASQRPPELDLLSGLTAAIRAPMANLAGYSELLTSGTKGHGDQIHRFLSRIDVNLDRTRLGLNNLLALLDVSASHQPAGTRTDITRLVTEAVERAEAQCREKGLIVDVGAAGDLPNVSIDPDAAATILDNLLANASQRSPQGGEITIRLFTTPDRFGSQAVVVAVSDTGPALSRAGQPACRLADVVDDANMLFLDRLAEKLGCRAWVESQPPATRFCVRFPSAGIPGTTRH